MFVYSSVSDPDLNGPDHWIRSPGSGFMGSDPTRVAARVSSKRKKNIFGWNKHKRKLNLFWLFFGLFLEKKNIFSVCFGLFRFVFRFVPVFRT